MAFVAALPDLDWPSRQLRDLDDAVLFATSRAKLAPDREATIFFLVRATGKIRNFARVRPGEAPQLLLAFPPYRQIGLVLTAPAEPAEPATWTREGALQLALPFPAREP